MLLWVIDWLGFTTLLVIILRLVVIIENLPGLLRLGIIHWLLLVVDWVGLLGWCLVKIPLLRLVVKVVTGIHGLRLGRHNLRLLVDVGSMSRHNF